MKKKKRNHYPGIITRGKKVTKEYKTWNSMKQRCYNSNNASWCRYGGRGITVCKEWLQSFTCFLIDMGAAPTKDHQIDRVDIYQGYHKANCRWALPKVQARNKGNSWLVLHNQKEQHIFTILEEEAILSKEATAAEKRIVGQQWGRLKKRNIPFNIFLQVKKEESKVLGGSFSKILKSIYQKGN